MYDKGSEKCSLKSAVSIGIEDSYRNNDFLIGKHALNNNNNEKLSSMRKNFKGREWKKKKTESDDQMGNEEQNMLNISSVNNSGCVIKSLKVVKFGSGGLKPFIQFISENIFKIKLDYFSLCMIPALQNILNSLKEKYNQFARLINMRIESLNESICKKLQNIDQKDLLVMQAYYNFLPKDKHKQLRKKYNLILSLKHCMNYVIIKRYEIYNNAKYYLKFFESIKCEFNFLKIMANIASSIINKLMHNVIFFYPSIFPLGKIFKLFFELFDVMDDLIKCITKSFKNGFLLTDRTKMDSAKKIIDSINNKLRQAFYRHLNHLVKDLNLINLTNKDNDMTIQIIFYFLQKENIESKKYLEDILTKSHNENIIKILFDLLSQEGNIISEYHDIAHKYFNLNFHESNKNDIYLNKLIENKKKEQYLSSIYKTLMKLMRITYFHNKLQLIAEMRKLLKKMNSKKKRKSISVTTKKILTQALQLNLLSEIEEQKKKLEEIKLDVKYSHIFSSLKKKIEDISVAILVTYEKIEEIALTFHLKALIIHQDLVNARKANGEKLIRPENILFALYYVKHVITKCIIEEIQ